MKKSSLYLGSGLIALGILASSSIFTSCNGTSDKAGNETATDTLTCTAGKIVYFDLDRVIDEYDMANDLKAVVETKVAAIEQEIKRKQSKLEKDFTAFQDKINKGLLTQSVAEIQGRKLAEDRDKFTEYAAQKQQEIADEQAVYMRQVADAINSYLETFNAEKQYAMILTTQGDILKAPVAMGDPELDITDDILEGINAEYVANKKSNKEN